VNHIFGFNESPGWGLRTVTEKNFNEFRMLYDFFQPHGAFFQLIYRLQRDTVKFELNCRELPIKVRQMLESGRFSTFFSGLLSTESNFQSRNLSLSLSESKAISESLEID
jgi:sphingomyelin phosphodiesterase 4